jgi:hypothetical protein
VPKVLLEYKELVVLKVPKVIKVCKVPLVQ